MTSVDSPLKNFLESTRLLSRAEADELMREAKGDELLFSKLLLEEGRLSEDDLVRAKSHVWGLSMVSLIDKKLDPKALGLIPEAFARGHNVVAYHLSAEGLEVALLEPTLVQEVSALVPVGIKVLPRLTTSSSIKYAMREYRKLLEQEFGGKIKASIQEIASSATPESASKLLDLVLTHAEASNTSTIHLEPGERDLLVRYRLRGRLETALALPLFIHEALVSVIEERFGKSAAIMPTAYGKRVVITTFPSVMLEHLGLRPASIETINQALASERGLMLVTGGSLSGKSTLGYSLLGQLTNLEKSIVTVEENISKRLSGVSQATTSSSMGLPTEQLLKAALRQDPDVVLVDEVENAATASLLSAHSLTRGLGFGIVRGKTAIDALLKFTDMTGRESAISNLRCIIGCAVIRRLGEHQEKYFLSAADIKNLSLSFDLDLVLRILKDEGVVERNATWETIPFYRPAATGESDGYVGNVGVYQVMPLADWVKDLVRAGVGEKELLVESRRLGVLTLAEEGLVLAVRGLTTLEEVLRTL